ncbi:MAG: DUF6134 family protein [Mesonia hippocampi]|uniref:DUF6134 family protein n=1 Tax=Mesonia hippocampi TaxID=1628250 RepID=UPI003F97C3D4
MLREKLCLVLFIFLAHVFTSTAQQKTLLFDILHKDKKIGKLHATKNVNDSLITYTSNTEISTKIITSINVLYSYLVVYKDHKLQEAKTLIKVNDKIRTQTHTLYRDGVYYFSEKENNSQRLDAKKITYSTVKLMFEEPKNITSLFAEEHGNFHKLAPTALHAYKKTIPGESRKENTYIYKNGTLAKGILDVGIISFELQKATN